MGYLQPVAYESNIPSWLKSGFKQLHSDSSMVGWVPAGRAQLSNSRCSVAFERRPLSGKWRLWLRAETSHYHANA